MSIDIRGVNTHNKGAHLMLVAIVNQLDADMLPATSPNGSSFEDRVALGLRQTVLLDQAARLSALGGSLLPKRGTELFGMTRMIDLTGVLDASGFAYSDAFGPLRARREASLVPLWRRNGTPRVFLPQAFGPFRDPTTAKYSRKLLQQADLVYARDQVSMQYLIDLGLRSSRLRLCPDFTVLEAGTAPRQLPAGPFGVLVPNSKLVTHGTRSMSDYIRASRQVLGTFARLGLRPVVAPHESTDINLAKQIVEGSNAEVYWTSDPLEIKGFLGAAEIVVGSRFHALVGSLSSGRPTVGLGWSHKYGELFADYGVRHWVAHDGEDLNEYVTNVLSDKSGAENLRLRGAEIKKSVAEMWLQVHRTLGSSS